MRALVQRVSEASVEICRSQVGKINSGLVVLLGISREDNEQDARYLVEKVSNLRIFSDKSNTFHYSALDIGAELLVISQFTLYASTRHGRRPNFAGAAPPDKARVLYHHAIDLFKRLGLKVETGQFQEYMVVSIRNEGPITIMIDSADRRRPNLE